MLLTNCLQHQRLGEGEVRVMQVRDKITLGYGKDWDRLRLHKAKVRFHTR